MKIFGIVSSLLILTGCPDNKADVKIYNVESQNVEMVPGLVRRSDEGKVISHVSFDEAHKKYGCMSWDDIDEIIDQGGIIIRSIDTIR